MGKQKNSRRVSKWVAAVLGVIVVIILWVGLNSGGKSFTEILVSSAAVLGITATIVAAFILIRRLKRSAGSSKPSKRPKSPQSTRTFLRVKHTETNDDQDDFICSWDEEHDDDFEDDVDFF